MTRTITFLTLLIIAVGLLIHKETTARWLLLASLIVVYYLSYYLELRFSRNSKIKV